MKNKTVAILGLGLFGASVAKTLANQEVEVIAMDKNMERVEEVMDHVEQAVQGDFTKYDQLVSAGVDAADVAIIASGERLETSIMGVLNLKKLGVAEVIVKTKNKDYLEVLRKVGADRVLLPEVESGMRLANELAEHSIIDSFQIDDNYNIVEIHALTSWCGKSLEELNLRANYGFNVLAVKTDKLQEFSIVIDPKMIIHEGYLFVVLVDEASLAKFNEDNN